MKRFARLYAELDATTSTNAKLDALKRYFASAAPADAAWAAYFLSGGRPRQAAPTRLLRDVAVARAGIDDWLFEECYQAVGDLAETIAHVLPPAQSDTDVGLAEWVEQRLLPLRGMAPEAIAERLVAYWDELDWWGRFLLLKLIGGGFRVGVSRLLVIRALAEVAGVDSKIVAQRIVGYAGMGTRPTAATFSALIAPASDAGAEGRAGQPYPFFLAHQLTGDVAALGAVGDWLVEWKWDGIRGQLVKRDGRLWLWSRGEELITERFPELQPLAATVPDGTVIDGEILVWRDDQVRPFAELQTRIGRKTLSPKILAGAPVALLAYDLLEENGVDVRAVPQAERRRKLEALVLRVADPHLVLSPLLVLADWDAYAALRAESRARGVEGFMLKRRDARYGVGRTKDVGTWWKWKIDPMTIDAVLVYAQRGHGRRASLYTDYTFAVWSDDEHERRLIPFAKAYSGLSDDEILQVDAIVRRTTIEKFGPVRNVTPSQVFELGFEGIQRSPRHKSGIAVRFPRILRWRTDKPIEEANSLRDLAALLREPG